MHIWTAFILETRKLSELETERSIRVKKRVFTSPVQTGWKGLVAQPTWKPCKHQKKWYKIPYLFEKAKNWWFDILNKLAFNSFCYTVWEEMYVMDSEFVRQTYSKDIPRWWKSWIWNPVHCEYVRSCLVKTITAFPIKSWEIVVEELKFSQWFAFENQ